MTTLLNDYQKIASEALGVAQDATLTPASLATLVAASAICKALQDAVEAIDYLSVNLDAIEERLYMLSPDDEDEEELDEASASVDPTTV